MDMRENNIKNAINGIGYSENTKTRIWGKISLKNDAAHKDVTRRIFSGKMKAAIALACVAVLIVIVNVRSGSQYGTQISVYAKNAEGGEEQIVLSPGEQVELQSMETPAGYGYVFEVNLPDNYTYVITPVRASENSYTMYQDGGYVYWINNQYVDDDEVTYIVSDGDSEVREDEESHVTFQHYQYDGKDIWINTEYVDNEELKIIIYNDLSEISEEKTIRVEATAEGCTAVLAE